MSRVRLLLPLTLALSACSAAPVDSTDHAGEEPGETFTVMPDTVPAPSGDVLVTARTRSDGTYIVPLPPQVLDCIAWPRNVGCKVDRVYFGMAPDISTFWQSYALMSFWDLDFTETGVIMSGHLMTVQVTDHRTNPPTTSTETWFTVSKLYAESVPNRRIPVHSTQYFYATGTITNAKVVPISQADQAQRSARITWKSSVLYAPTSVEDMIITGTPDFTRSPVPIQGDAFLPRRTAAPPPQVTVPPPQVELPAL
jgi:hypothetical protein